MNNKGINKVFVLCLFFIFSSFQYSYGQSFGLGFNGYDVHQDKRTGLDLSPDGPVALKNNFELSFDLSLRRNQKTYYGYIVRIIRDNHSNIDLIYKDDLPSSKHFKLIIGDTYSGISFEIPQKKLTEQWNHIRLRFDCEKGKLTLYSGKESFSQLINFRGNGAYKFLFGANKFGNFQTIDTPPMLIRNVKLTDGGKAKYYWQLNEYNGNIAHDDISKAKAYVTNALWIKEKHYDWEHLKTMSLAGECSVAIDNKTENLYIIGKDTVFNYRVPQDTLIAYACTDKQFIMQGTQSIFIPYNHELLDVSIDRKQVAAFNFDKKHWDKQLNDSLPYSAFYQHNKFFSPADTSLYIIGGYGYYLYKNQVSRYHFSSKSWESIKTGGDFMAPHYLSALGATRSGAYILGGYGSITGEQTINPRFFYSLTYFDVKGRTFKKIYDLKLPAHDFVFANSMIINEASNSYYALLFDKDSFNSKLQLVYGSLKNPEFIKVGNVIPYTFQDISSFADLFYCKKSGRFIVVTLYRNEKHVSKINIYSLNSPPVISGRQYNTVTTTPAHWYFMGLAVLIGGLCAAYLYSKRRHRGGVDRGMATPAIGRNTQTNSHLVHQPQNTIYLFGDFQVFDAEGTELTKCFTPLIKELFLIMLVYSIRWGRGISSKKLEELLWADKSINNAHSNRSVNIGRLKNILSKINNCTISKDSGYWKIDIENINVDYKKFITIINNRDNIDKSTITDFTAIIHRGCFLPDADFEWLDSFKAEITNEVVNIYLEFAASITIEHDPEFMIQLATHVFNFDPVNEEAMIIKCRALSYLGKHSLAKTTFENFSKEYETIYGEKFQKNFHDIMDMQSKI